MADTYLKPEQLITGHAYRMFSRNLGVGVWNGRDGFIGIRSKFGQRYLFTEIHWDLSEHFGTVKPYEDLGPLVPPEMVWELKLNERDPNDKFYEQNVELFNALDAFEKSVTRDKTGSPA